MVSVSVFGADVDFLARGTCGFGFAWGLRGPPSPNTARTPGILTASQVMAKTDDRVDDRHHDRMENDTGDGRGQAHLIAQWVEQERVEQEHPERVRVELVQRTGNRCSYGGGAEGRPPRRR